MKLYSHIILIAVILKAVLMANTLKEEQRKYREATKDSTQFKRNNCYYKPLIKNTTINLKETKGLTKTLTTSTRKSQDHKRNQLREKYSVILNKTQERKTTCALEQIIRMARGILKLPTLVIFSSSKNDLRNLENLSNFPQDKIIITQQQQWQLRELFSGNILSIVFLEDRS